MSGTKRTASKVDEDTVANVAEVVWGLLTGTLGSVNPSAMSAFAGNTAFETFKTYTLLRRTNKAAAAQFAKVHRITPAKVSVSIAGDGTHSVTMYFPESLLIELFRKWDQTHYTGEVYNFVKFVFDDMHAPQGLLRITATDGTSVKYRLAPANLGRPSRVLQLGNSL